MSDQGEPRSTADVTIEETRVEQVDNARRRALLAGVLIILVLLMIALVYVVARLNQPKLAPKADDLPAGIGWVRSIYAFGDGADQLMDGPVDTDIAPDGTIWVSTNRRVLAAFTPDGQVKSVIAPPVSNSPGHFVTIEGIAVADDGDVYVCDSGRNAVLVFDEEGELLREWGVELPQEIDVRDGTVAVAASAGVALFTTEGDLIAQWGQRGKEDADVDLPHGIQIGEDGSVYVSDTQNRRLKAYSREGRLQWIKTANPKADLKSQAQTETVEGILQNLQLPAGMTFDGAGRLIIVDPFEFQVLAVDIAQRGLIVERWGRYGAQDGRFAYPTGIAYDPARDWFAVADTANNRVQIIRLPGSGGSAIRALGARFTDQPWCLCLIPLLFLLAAISIWVTHRRRESEGATSVPEVPQSA